MKQEEKKTTLAVRVLIYHKSSVYLVRQVSCRLRLCHDGRGEVVSPLYNLYSYVSE